MSNNGDDCYFYYYSTCTKGDSCPFRHCDAAMGSETVCCLWQEGRCFRTVCKFRHMEIDKKRKEIPCYWENQPGGCQKPHCAFRHDKPRVIGRVYVPPDKGPAVRKEKEEEAPQEDRVLSTPAPISSNPQLRGVFKAEPQESVPSPTHPPVVINPVDDEDDEDDQISEEGGESSGVSPRKVLSSSKDQSLDFGVQTLEEIRLRKALKASLKRAESPEMLNSDGFAENNKGAGTEKENIRSLKQPPVLTNRNESTVTLGKRRLADRLGKQIYRDDIPGDSDLKLKGSLAKRLGGFMESPQNNPDMQPQKSLKPVRERLGIAADLAASKSTISEPKPSGEICIKTLEEIRQEKAAKSQMQQKGVGVATDVPTAAQGPTKRGNRPVSGPHMKTYSETLQAKKKFQEEKCVSPEIHSTSEKSKDVTNAGAVKVPVQVVEVRVKTLEEIRKEKAARMQAQAQAEDTASDNTASDVPPKRQIPLFVKNKPASNISSQKQIKKVDHVAEQAAGKTDSSGQAITVKSFEEIMREKRMRKQQEEQATSANQQEVAAQKSNVVLSKETHPTTIKPRITAPTAAQESPNQAKPSVRSRLGLKTETSSDIRTKETSPAKSPQKFKESPPVALSIPVPEMASAPGFPRSDSVKEIAQGVSKTSQNKATEMKERPLLNVKPSIMKLATPVKPGQKRKAAGSHCSAVAAVKPLNAVSEPETEPPCKRVELSPQDRSDVVVSTQKISHAEQSIALPSKTTSSVAEPHPVPQSPVIKTPAQARLRRSSVASGRVLAPSGNTSMVDDFEDLLDEFADDRLEDEIELDPGKGEDDLLLELSEMIDG